MFSLTFCIILSYSSPQPEGEENRRYLPVALDVGDITSAPGPSRSGRWFWAKSRQPVRSKTWWLQWAKVLQACQIHGMLRLERCGLAVYIVLYIVLSCHYGLQLCFFCGSSSTIWANAGSKNALASKSPEASSNKIFGKSLGIPASVFPLPVAAIPQHWHFFGMWSHGVSGLSVGGLWCPSHANPAAKYRPLGTS